MTKEVPVPRHLLADRLTLVRNEFFRVFEGYGIERKVIGDLLDSFT